MPFDHEATESPSGSTDRGRPPRSYRVARATAIVLPIVVLVVVAVAFLVHRSSGEPSSRDLNTVTLVASPVPQNQPASEFTLPTLAGSGSVSLRQYAGKVVVLNLWASWCAPCRDEAPKLEALWQAYRSLDVQFLGVDQQDSKAAAADFVRRFGLTYPTAFDPEGTIAAKYGALGLPTTFVIDGQGTVRYRFLGRIDPVSLQSIVQGLLTEGS